MVRKEVGAAFAHNPWNVMILLLNGRERDIETERERERERDPGMWVDGENGGRAKSEEGGTVH